MGNILRRTAESHDFTRALCVVYKIKTLLERWDQPIYPTSVTDYWTSWYFVL